MSFTTSLRARTLDWPDGEPFEDVPRGTLKSGKEAEGELRELGFSNSTAYRGDAVYRAGWNVGARDRRALAAGNKSRHGHELAARMWPAQEWSMLRRAWEAGASVPYPIERTDDGLLMEFIGDDSQAAPKLAQAKLQTDALEAAWAQLVDNLRALTAAGLVHADLSAYNLLWWRGSLVVIDLPQAVEFTTNTDAFELLHRDVANAGGWFARHGVAVDVEALYAELVSLAWLG